MKRLSLLAACVAALTAVPCLAEDSAKLPPKIQIAILLDTSGSMDGLINQTREQLWRIVNTFATAKRDGKPSTLELALYEYGNSRLAASDHFVRRVVPLTSDLDRVSEALFALTTDGGDEYCGAVIHHATQELEWSSRPGDLKLVYVAGNEPFTQGPIAYQVAAKAAIKRGIVVNTIHAGAEADGITGQWQAAAKLADGHFLFIDQNRAVARVDAPQDAELAALSAKLNATYVAYGPKGEAAAERQAAQDKNAMAMSPSAMSTRAAAKSSALYDTSGWDLVDLKRKGGKVAELAADSLPAPMRGMDAAQRDAYVEAKAKDRADLQAQITRLTKAREAYVRDELARRAAGSAKTMDDALVESAKTQAAKASYTF
jgi:hypothetical protein